MDESIKIKSKEEALEKTKWLRRKLNKWGGMEGFQKVNRQEKIEFIKILETVEKFFGIEKT